MKEQLLKEWEIIQENYDEKLKDKVEYERQLKVVELEERIESQSMLIKNFVNKAKVYDLQIEGYKKRPSKEAYDDLQGRFDEYINATKNLKKSSSTSSLSSNDDDGKYKKKYRALKKDYEKLQMKHLKLKEKLDDNDDTSDEDDTSSDDD